MKELLKITNQLHEKQRLLEEWKLELPQIVVVGMQSAGKSSVLDSLIREPVLPRGEGTVTRCAIVLKLNHISRNQRFTGQNDSSKVPVSDAGKWCAFSYLDGRERKYFTNFDEVRQEIEAETKHLAGPNNNIVTDQRISLDIFSPDVVDLTLVDLPGIVKVPTGSQPKDIERQVTGLVMNNIREDSTIILAVCQANVDIVTNDSIKIAETVDSLHNRTIVVMTKLDTVQDEDEQLKKVLNSEIVQFHLGIIGVKNRSQKDIDKNKSISDSIKDEEEFLQTRYPELARTNGTKFLEKTLQAILKKKIRECLPELQSSLERRVIAVKEELALYGDEVTQDEKENFLLAIIQQFRDGFLKKISLSEGGDIRKIFHEIFPAQVDRINPADSKDLPHKVILDALDKHEGIESFAFLPTKAFLAVMKTQVNRLQLPGSSFVDSCHSKIKTLVDDACAELGAGRFPFLLSEMKRVSKVHLAECYRKTRLAVEEAVKVEACAVLIQSSAFTEEVQDLIAEQRKKAKDGIICTVLTPDQKCWIVRELIQRYFKVSKDRFKDFCQKRVVYHITRELESNLYGLLTKKLYRDPSLLDDLLEESHEISTKRKLAKRQLADLEEVLGIIQNFEDTQ